MIVIGVIIFVWSFMEINLLLFVFIFVIGNCKSWFFFLFGVLFFFKLCEYFLIKSLFIRKFIGIINVVFLLFNNR